jgi:lipopolysaccharide transport system permease protein
VAVTATREETETPQPARALALGAVELVIKRSERNRLDLRELWAYRELFYFLAWRDFKVRYKQTAIGAAWALFQPVLTMVVFTIFFNRVIGISAPGGNYPVFSFVALLYWNFFVGSFQNASNSLVNSQALVTKVYFPRVIAPFAATLVSVADFAFAAVVLAGLMAYYLIAPGILGVLLAVPMLALAFLWSSGLGMLLAAVNVKYRDVRQILPFLVQTMLFVTPVIYPVSFIPQRFRLLMYANPMAGVVNTIRAGLTHQGAMDWAGLGISALVAVGAFSFGLRYFMRSERRFADII